MCCGNSHQRDSSLTHKVLKNRPSKICGRQPLKEHGQLKQTMLLQFF